MLRHILSQIAYNLHEEVKSALSYVSGAASGAARRQGYSGL